VIPNLAHSGREGRKVYEEGKRGGGGQSAIQRYNDLSGNLYSWESSLRPQAKRGGVHLRGRGGDTVSFGGVEPAVGGKGQVFITLCLQTVRGERAFKCKRGETWLIASPGGKKKGPG